NREVPVVTACWSVKGGSGTTVVAATLALLLARSHDAGVLLVDLGGDVPSALGVSDPDGPGVFEWLAAGDQVPADGLARIETPVLPGVSLVARGTAGERLPLDRVDVLASLLGREARPVV